MSAFTVVVVLHDSGPELRALLPSLERHAAGRRSWWSSTPARATAARARAREHGAELIELPDNPGFGAANNAGVARARHDVTVLLNPDCELVDDSLHALAALARIHPRALHAPRLLEPDGTVQRSAHPLPGTVGALLPALVHPPLLPRALRERAEPYRAERPRTVGWAIAACLAADTALLRELGPFDPAVHLFAEDMELGLRARAARRPDRPAPARCASATPAGTRSLRDGEPFELLARRRREAIARRSDRAPARSTTSRRRSRSPPASPRAPRSAATPPASARSSPRCAGKSGASRSGAGVDEA